MPCRNFRPRVVLLVGGDDATARDCARHASPIPVLRAKHLAMAAARFRSMRPIVLVVAADVPTEDASELERLAAEHATNVVRLEPGFDGSSQALRQAVD
jgi:hypothetical protein